MEVLDVKLICMLYVPFPADRDYAAWCKSLMERKLAASINALHGKSFLFWEGRLHVEDEIILVMKTSREKADELKKVVKAEHPYRVPAILELLLSDVNKDYLEWVMETTSR
ncbi:MAG: divalent-cation tolerance protein CutA [Candidatus Caldarchaeum sp.]